jgi:hypothetical protein
MFVAENFIRSLVHKYGKHTVYTNMVNIQYIQMVVHGINKHATLCI